MRQFIKTKWFRISAIVALLVLLYALAGFWLAPKLVRNALMKDIPATLGLTPSVGDIHINPFLFQVELTDFSLADTRGEKLVGFKRFFLDFELSSLWHRAYSFANIDIAQPFVNAVVAKNGDLNLLALKGKPSAAPAKPADAKSSIPPLRIRDFNVSDGSVSYDDRSTPSGFSARLEPLNFDLKEFTTGIDGGRFTFTAASKEGERFEWHGHLSVQPIESDGEFQIEGLKVHTIWDYLEDKLNFAVNSGTLDLNANYRFALKDSPDLDLNLQKVALTGLAVRPKGGDADWISLPQLLVSDTHVALAPKKIDIGAINLTGLKVSAWLNADGSVNLTELTRTPTVAAAPGTDKLPPPKVAVNAPAANTAPWSLSLHALELKDAAIQAEDRSVKPATKIALAPLNVKVEEASLDLAKPVKVMLDATINGGGKLSFSGPITPQPLAAELAVKMADIELSVAQPYLAQYTSMTLNSGLLSGETKVVYGASKPQVSVAGNISVTKFRTLDNALHQDFVNWDQLQLQGIDFQHGPDRLNIDQVLAQKLYARVIIEPDTSLNVKRVLAGPNATVVAPGTPGTTAAPVTATATAPPPKSRRAQKGAARTPAAKPQAAPGMPILVKNVIIQASEADFADLTVQPNFSTGIQNLEGTVSNLSSRTGSRAKIDLKGQVDPFAPVSISGEANFLSTVLYTDIALSFRNIELSTFNPYSGKFAGYNIAKGKLTTEFHYKVDDRKLDATHHIVVDQLEFGEKTESKQAVSLPIKLAVALLKDKNGVIDLSFPLTGTIDDPQFKLRPVIWSVVVRILEDAVTAPFRLLARAFGGGPDMQFIDFEPGAADLDAAGTDKAHAIAKALVERPQLKIEVPIAALKELDGASLVDAQLKSQITDAQALRKKASAPFDQLDAAAKVEVLTLVYQSDFGGAPKYPDEVTGIKAKPDQLAAKVDWLTQQARGHIALSAADLTALGQQRAANLQKALLTDTQIDPERVFLVANDKAKADNGKVRLELSLR